MLKIVGIFIGLILFQFSFGQSLALENYTPGNGLVDARVSKMFQDSKGRLFFLTAAGFSIFDGQHFDNYGNDIHQGTGIISDIAEYENGLIKVFSYDGDIYTVKNQEVDFDSTHREQLKELSKVFAINEHEKIILTNYHLIRDKGNQFQLLRLHAIKPGFVENSLQIDNHLILIQWNENKTQKVYLYNFQQETIEDSISVSNPISYINQLDNKIVCATNTPNWFQIDASMIEKGKLSLKPYQLLFEHPKQYENGKVQFLADNICWFIQPSRGYTRVTLPDHKTESFTLDAGILNAPHWVFEDAEKNYWFGSSGSGVQKYQRSTLSRINKIDKYDLGNVQTLNQGIYSTSFIEATGGVFFKEHKIADFKIDNNYFIHWKGQSWQFTDYKTLVSNLGKVFKLDQLIDNYQPEEYLFSHSFIDSKGRLVIAGRIFLFIENDFTFHYYRPAYFCDNIVQTGSNDFVCFLRNNQVIKLRINQDGIHKTYTQSIPDLSPRYTIQFDSTSFLCGTRLGGIRIFQWDQHQFVEKGNINRAHGLTNNFVNVLLKIDAQSFVAGTSVGLDRIHFNGHDTTIDNLSLINNIFLPFVELVKSSDSTLLTRTLDGQLFKVSFFENRALRFTPQCYFKNVQVNNASVDWEKQKQFNYSNNNFLFSVSTPTYFESKRIKFLFQLSKDGEIQWQQNSNLPDFEIKNLPPGSYALQVIVKYPSQKYALKQLNYSFVIAPPFWKQWWFIVISILSITGATTLFFYWVYRRKLNVQINKMERVKAIEKERTRIALDMHDDFGSNLSRIKFISEKIQLLHKQDAALVHDLSKISFFSDEMIEKLNEIVWALNQRYDSLDDLIGYCRSYVADYLQDKNIELIFDAPVHINSKISGEIRRNIFVVIKESIHNVVKHSGANQVKIKFTLGDQLEINIKDNGKGIDVNNIRAFANGISNMKERIETVGGSLNIGNNNGTEIKITIPV